MVGKTATTKRGRKKKVDVVERRPEEVWKG